LGRKTIDDPRSVRKTLRFTPAELLASEEAAAAAGLTWSEWTRGRAMDRKAAAKAAAASAGGRKRSGTGEGRAPLPPFDADRLSHLRPLYDELHHQGVNLNQIAHRMHRQDMALPPPELYAVLEAIRALLTPPAKSKTEPPKGGTDGA